MMLAARSGGLANAADGVLHHGLQLEETCPEPWLVEKRREVEERQGRGWSRALCQDFLPQLANSPATGGGESWLAERRKDVEMGAASLVPSLTTFLPKVVAAVAGGKELLTFTSHDPASGEEKCSVISYPW